MLLALASTLALHAAPAPCSPRACPVPPAGEEFGPREVCKKAPRARDKALAQRKGAAEQASRWIATHRGQRPASVALFAARSARWLPGCEAGEPAPAGAEPAAHILGYEPSADGEAFVHPERARLAAAGLALGSSGWEPTEAAAPVAAGARRGPWSPAHVLRFTYFELHSDLPAEDFTAWAGELDGIVEWMREACRRPRRRARAGDDADGAGAEARADPRVPGLGLPADAGGRRASTTPGRAESRRASRPGSRRIPRASRRPALLAGGSSRGPRRAGAARGRERAWHAGRAAIRAEELRDWTRARAGR